MRRIAVDIGGTKIETAVVEEDRLFEIKEEPLDKSHPLEQILRMIQSYSDPLPVGIGMAGQIQNGVLVSSPNFPLSAYPLKHSLEKQLSRSVTLLNDVQAAAYAEARFGKGAHLDRLLVVYLGTGIGSGLVVNGKLQTGGAGELGHTVIVQGGLLCTCGRKGCLEAYASGWGLAKQGGVEEAKALMKPDQTFPAEIGFKALVTAFANVANFFNPEKIILGGNLLKGYERVFPHFLSDLNDRVKKEAFLPNGENLIIEKSAFSETGVLIGAGNYS
jgi:glucokinase